MRTKLLRKLRKMARKGIKVEVYSSSATLFQVYISSDKYPSVLRSTTNVEYIIPIRYECMRKVILRELANIRVKQLLKDNK